MSWGQGVADLAKKVAEYHKELVTTSVRFDELRRQTKETLDEFKGALERMNVKVNDTEKRHFEMQTTLNAKIDSLTERLNILSEKALHAAVRDAANQYILKAEEISKGVGPHGGEIPTDRLIGHGNSEA